MLGTLSIESKLRGAVCWQTEKDKSEKIIPVLPFREIFNC